MKLNRPPITQYTPDLSLDMIKTDDTLNLFSDASMRTINKRKHILASCYGSVAVNKDQIVDERFRVQSESTVPAAEIRGIRCSLSLALKHRYQFRTINIFSDSQIAIFGLRDYIYNWKYDYKLNQFYSGNRAAVVKNQELFIECFQMLQDLRMTNIVNIFHQSGHVDSRFDDIKKAAEIFKRSNGIYGTISYELIRYISVYNNYIDNKSRSFIRTLNVYENNYQDPIKFYSDGNLFFNK